MDWGEPLDAYRLFGWNSCMILPYCYVQFFDRITIPQKPKPIYSAKVTAYALNVRKGPGLNYDPIGHRLAGDIVEVYETSNGWARIGEGQWVSLNWIVRI